MRNDSPLYRPLIATRKSIYTANETARNFRIERTLGYLINEYNTCAGKDEKQLFRMYIRAVLRIEFNGNGEW